jgi:hypothetical protein
MPVTNGDQAAGTGRPRSRLKIIWAVSVPVIGVIILGFGISGLHNHDVLVAQGVPVVARVSATSGYGRNTIQVSYPVGGRQTQGTIGVDGTYHLGETVAVVYDPQSPQVVAAQGSLGSTFSAWSEVGTGCALLAFWPICFLISRRSARRRRAAGSIARG